MFAITASAAIPNVSPGDFLTALIAAIFALGFFRRRWRQRRRHERPAFPAAWRTLLKVRLPLLARLSRDQRVLHRRRTQEFLQDIRFIGCDGLIVTDEMRVLIAGMACLLILRPEASVYRGLQSVRISPAALISPDEENDRPGTDPGMDPRAAPAAAPPLRPGESWNGQRVTLSWDDVEAALGNHTLDVVAQAFAGQLDDENPGTPGAPRLASHGNWPKLMRREFAALQSRSSSVLDDRGRNGPQAFFAVATEAYFGNGAALERVHPELYRLLRSYYRIDTARLVV